MGEPLGAALGALVGVFVAVGAAALGTQLTLDCNDEKTLCNWLLDSREAMVTLVPLMAPMQMLVLLSCGLWMHWTASDMPLRLGALENASGT